MELAGEMPMQQGTGSSAPRASLAWIGSDFEAVFLEHYSRIVGVLQRMLGDRARAEELAADTFLKLCERRIDASRLENPGGWLYRTATRLGIDALRAEARRQRYEQKAAGGSEVRETPLDDVLRAETCRAVRAALGRLKPLYAQMLTLRSHGFSYRELAGALEVKPQSVGRLLMRAEEAFEKAYRRVAPSRAL